MKRPVKYKPLSFLFIIFLFFSCSKNDEISPSNVKDVITAGKWEVSGYGTSKNDERDSFSPYLFTFNPEGTLMAEGSSQSYFATWNIIQEAEEIKLQIIFPENLQPFSNLNKSWIVTSLSSVKVETVESTGANNNNQTAFLSFQKL